MGDIKKKETYIMSSNGKDKLHVVVWEPEGEKKGVVQQLYFLSLEATKYNGAPLILPWNLTIFSTLNLTF